MKGRTWLWLAALLAVSLLAFAGCGGDDDDDEGAGGTTAMETGAAEEAAPASVNLQLKWVTQAQFAGYYAALE
jgi:NitT/TauT family transport system substrate-binding protein